MNLDSVRAFCLSMPNATEDDLVYITARHGYRHVEGYISSSNLVDFQHLKTVHGIKNPIPTSIVSSNPTSIRRRRSRSNPSTFEPPRTQATR